MANGWSIIWGLIVIVVWSAVSWFVAPKGDTQAIWRSTLILSAVCCYLMWVITFFAQWHPLIAPIRNNLRPEYYSH